MILKKQPTLLEQHTQAMKDSQMVSNSLTDMIEKLHRKEVTPEDLRPYFEMCQRKDQQLLDIEATIRREHIRTLDVSSQPSPPPTPDLEVNISLAIRYLTEIKEKTA